MKELARSNPPAEGMQPAMGTPSVRSSPRAWSVRVGWMALVIVVAGFAAYFNALPAPFIFDDEPAIMDNPTIWRLPAIGKVLSPPANGAGVTGRPVVNFTLALDYAAWGTSVRGFRATNIAIHVLGALVLFGLVRRSLGLAACAKGALPPAPGNRQTVAAWLAFAIALLWTVHPLQTETVVCVIQRTESMVSLFYLLTLYCFARAVEPGAARAGSARSGREPSRLWLGLAWLACLLGMATKEVMVSAPVIVFLYDRTFVAGSFAAAWRVRRRWYVGLGATWLLLVWLVIWSGGTRGMTAGYGRGVSAFEYLLTQAHAVTLYLKLSFWPHPLVVDYGNEVVRRIVAVLPQIALIGVLLVAALVALWRWPRVGFVGAAFFAILAPSSSVVPLVTQTIAEHRMHLPLACVLVLVVLALHRVARGRALLAAGALLAMVAAATTVRRNVDYLDDLRLWTDTVMKRPTSARAHGNLGATYHNRGMFGPALTHATEAYRLDLHTAQPRYNLGLALEKNGRLEEAAARYREALEIFPEFVPAKGSLAMVLSKLERFDEALRYADAALAQVPDKPAWLCLRGVALAGLRRYDEAVAVYEATLRLAPTFVEAEANLGAALYRVGRYDEATRHLERALQLSPELPDAYFNLGLIAAAKGEPERAVKCYLEACQRDPGHALARLNLGIVYAQQGRFDEAESQLAEAVRLKPGLAEAHGNLGVVLVERGQFERAEKSYQEALRLRPDYANAHYNFGNLLLQTRRVAEAKQQFEETVRLAPNFTAAREMLARIEAIPQEFR